MANLRPATLAANVVGMIVRMRTPWVKLVLTSDGGADGSFMLHVFTGVFEETSNGNEAEFQATCRNTLFQQAAPVYRSYKDMKLGDYVVLIDLPPSPYSVDLHARFLDNFVRTCRSCTAAFPRRQIK